MIQKKSGWLLIRLLGFSCICTSLFHGNISASTGMVKSPCQASINDLRETYETNTGFSDLIDRALANTQPLPAEYPFENPC